LAPGRARPTGLGPSQPPPFRLHVGGVDDRAAPVDLTRRVQPLQQDEVELVPDARVLPLVQPAPGRHTDPEAKPGRQMLPADPRVQHKQDALQHETIVQPAPAGVTKVPHRLRQQRLDELPQLIVDHPRLRPRPSHRRPPYRVTPHTHRVQRQVR
jgi:hypothetical protein